MSTIWCLGTEQVSGKLKKLSYGESVSQAEKRAHGAAMRLVLLAQENRSVFLVEHGIMTMLIAKHLLAMGWSGPKRPVMGYWQFAVYHGPS